MGQTKIGWDFFIFVFSLLAITVTDTAFRESSLGNLFIGKIVPGTSKNWPQKTDLLVFYLKFKLSTVSEYLNYYYNITNDCWAIREKSNRSNWGHTLFKKALNPLDMSFYPWIFWTKRALFTLEISVKLCYTPWKFKGQKPSLMKIQHDVFLITPKNFTFNLENCGQNKALLLEIL